MESIVKGVEGLKNIAMDEGLEGQVGEKRALAAKLQEKLQSYQQRLTTNK